jgi:hypothetical protein|tara:strand:+ start:16547 stop:16654 length:108 start_codon:yes stop_codon:yes gene_type:complete
MIASIDKSGSVLRVKDIFFSWNLAQHRRPPGWAVL